ncbi:putative short chain dehydrogenase (AtsC) [Penicillium brasilianum]|uniref:Putative short chain dehydrogenase (AtsC) n=1 Tax=Penicillium brasilianum TaxID=104259 RepID=A0A1S9S2Q6_PENBI|nr:putative short chain dehydrogenase (AtsC) [Penicillium brasilianum]
MPSYVITGASRGLGEFLRQISSDSNNAVIGLVRRKRATEEKVKAELPDRTKIHIVEADITVYAALKNAAAEVATITGGGLDYLIANAGVVSHFDAYGPIGVLGQQPEVLEEDLTKCFKVNVVSNIHLFNLFTPLILKGGAEKVIAISSGQAALDVIPKLGIEVAALYFISKAGLNTAVAKFSAQYAKEGVLFMSICPGMVDTGHFVDATEEQMQGLGAMLGAFVEYAPNFKGPVPPEAAVKDVISVMEKASAKTGDGGSFVSHYGNQQWL